MRVRLLLLIILLAIPTIGHSQARIVSSCGSAPPGFPTSPGDPAPLVVDVNGNLCGDGTSTSTVTSGVVTGASVSTVDPVYMGGNTAGTLAPIVVCGSTVVVSQASSGTTLLVALSAGKKIYVCHYNLYAGGTVNVELEAGTTAGVGTGCTAGTSGVTGMYNMTTQGNVSAGNGIGFIAQTPASAALCINTSASQPVGGIVSYTQFGLGVPRSWLEWFLCAAMMVVYWRFGRRFAR